MSVSANEAAQEEDADAALGASEGEGGAAPMSVVSANETVGATIAPEAVEEGRDAVESMDQPNEWYYYVQNESHGPFPQWQMRDWYGSELIGRHLFVSQKGWDTWSTIGALWPTKEPFITPPSRTPANPRRKCPRGPSPDTALGALRAGYGSYSD